MGQGRSLEETFAMMRMSLQGDALRTWDGGMLRGMPSYDGIGRSALVPSSGYTRPFQSTFRAKDSKGQSRIRHQDEGHVSLIF